MKREDLQVGQKVYSASFQVPVDADVGASVYVHVGEFEVKMLGKSRFEIAGRMGRHFGEYKTHAAFIASLALSPAEAVAVLARHTEQRLDHAHKKYDRLLKQVEEERKGIMEWRNNHGL